MFKVTETQNKDTTRVYHLEGPQLETVRNFWEHLVRTKAIDSYEIEEVN